MKKRKILVTGGAGYIGSHVVRQLGAAGESVITLDNLSTGFEAAVTAGELSSAIPATPRCSKDIFTDARHRYRDALRGAHDRAGIGRRPAEVLPQQHGLEPHAAGSGGQQRREKHRVLVDGRRLRHSGRRQSVGRFTDSADQSLRHVETDDRVDVARSRGRRRTQATSRCAISTWRAASRRGTIGQSTPKATLLVKVACEAATGRRPGVSIFGTDYPTPDGTGLRDYIHVEDLAAAHLDALALPAQWWRLDRAELRLRTRLQRARGACRRGKSQRAALEHSGGSPSCRRPAGTHRRRGSRARGARLDSPASTTSTRSCRPASPGNARSQPTTRRPTGAA